MLAAGLEESDPALFNIIVKVGFSRASYVQEGTANNTEDRRKTGRSISST
jgi:hypothetical protein